MPQRPTVPVSEELYAPLGEVELCYQSFGTPGAEPLLLVMGLAAPLTWWDDEFCSLLAADGFHVVRFDNRDVGRSTKVSGPSACTSSSGRTPPGRVLPPTA